MFKVLERLALNDMPQKNSILGFLEYLFSLPRDANGTSISMCGNVMMMSVQEW